MEKEKLNVLIVSMPGIFQRLLTNNLSIKPEFEVVGLASGGLSAYSALRSHQLDVVVIGSDIPGNEVLELIAVLKENYPDIFRLVLRDTSREVQEMTRAGAHLAVRGFDLNGVVNDLLVHIQAKTG